MHALDVVHGQKMASPGSNISYLKSLEVRALRPTI